MKFRVSGVYQLKHDIAFHHPDAIVSIGGKDEWDDAEPALRGFTGQICRLEFADIDMAMQGCIPPFPNDLRRAADFIEALPQQFSVMVHCHAGISRSPAMAIFLAAWNGIRVLGKPVEPDTAQRYYDAGLKMAPLAVPMARIIEMADVLLPELNDGLRAARRAHREAQKAKDAKTVSEGRLITPW